MIKIICVCGARPNFMKIAPIMRAFNNNGKFETLLVHTGQHYDEKMSHLFLPPAMLGQLSPQSLKGVETLVVGGDKCSLELALQCVKKFVSTQFEGGRHERRVNKISCA